MPGKKSFKSVKSAWMEQYKKKSFKRKPASVARIKGPVVRADELKFYDIAKANYGCDTTGSVTLINLPAAQGSDYNQFVGRQYRMKSAHVRGIVRPTDDNTASCLAAVYLVWDNAADGGVAAISDIFNAATSISFPQVNNEKRFTILREWMGVLGKVSDNATASFAESPTAHYVELYAKLDAITQLLTTGSIQNGALLLVTLGSQAGATGAVAELATRVRFTDD